MKKSHAPVVRKRLGELEGIEAVVDKDSTAGLLAEALDADLLVVLTDVAGRHGAHGLFPDARIRAFVFASQLRPASVYLAFGVPGRRKQAGCRYSIPVARQQRQANAEDLIIEVDRRRFLS